jgi:L-fuconolactonase
MGPDCGIAEIGAHDVTRIDAHQHYWQLARGDYGWLTRDLKVLYRDYLPEDLKDTLTACSVSGTVLVQAAPTEEETLFLFDLARRHATILGVVGWVDFEAADVVQRIDALIARGGGLLKGLRPMVQDIADPAWLGRASIDGAFRAMAERGLVFDALVTPLHIEILEWRLLRHPNLACVIDHAGKPVSGDPALDAWSQRMHRIATHTQAYCKLSGLFTQFESPVSNDTLTPYVSRLFEYFGPERLIWGSDWPVLNLRASYREWLDTSLALVGSYAPQAAAAIFADNARRVYGLGKPPRGPQRAPS